MNFLPLVVFSVTAGVLSMLFTLVAVLRRRLRLLWYALAFFLIGGVCGGLAVYRAATGVYSRVKDAIAPRTGMEIYIALFGAPVSDCVRITRHRDQVIPKLDSGISLRLKTCSSEVKRILSMAPYVATRSANQAADRVYGGLDANGTFAPENLGDTITTYYWEVQPGRNWRWIYCDRDSSEVIVVDVLD